MAERVVITQEQLREVLFYDPATGVFTWLKATGPRCAVGSRAGHIRKDRRKRRAISVFGAYYPEHVLAWLYMTGEIPAHEVDHINGDASDNRWSNLRPATRAQNNQNTRRRADNTSGYKGVSLHEGRFAARIQAGGKRFFLGHFETPQEAHAAYCEAAKKHHGAFSNYG